MVLSTQKYDPGFSSRIPDPDPQHWVQHRISDPDPDPYISAMVWLSGSGTTNSKKKEVGIKQFRGNEYVAARIRILKLI
jgi:hypothetical protein